MSGECVKLHACRINTFGNVSENWFELLVIFGGCNIHQYLNIEKGNIKCTAMQCISKAFSRDKESNDMC